MHLSVPVLALLDSSGEEVRMCRHKHLQQSGSIRTLSKHTTSTRRCTAHKPTTCTGGVAAPAAARVS